MMERRTIAIDVDGTLLAHGRINAAIVARIREWIAGGVEVYVWSARGRDHARQAVEAAGLADVLCISKPTAILDDMGWSWIQYTRVLAREDLGIDG